jgi:hypothetical protein
MSKRLQVLLDDSEFRRLSRYARKKGTTVAAVVRESLASVGRDEPRLSVERKLAVIREAATHRFPAPDIDQMLAEIAAGYEQDLD